MAKRSASSDTSRAKQQGLFDNGLEEGSFDLSLGLKQLISRDLRGHDRYLVAAQISKATLKDVSKDSLDKKLSADPAYQPNVLELAVICKLTGSLDPFSYILKHLDSDVLNPGDSDLIEWARLQEQERIIKAKMDDILRRRGVR